jgi:D-aminopeptidase
VNGPPSPRPRARSAGLPVGEGPTGPNNAITDVPGVRVGHATVWRGGEDAGTPVLRTGVTAIWPHEGDPFMERVYAAVSPFNGYGVLTGDLVLAEWGLLGSPIVLCDTANLGAVVDGTIRAMTAANPAVGRDDVCIPVVGECDDGYLNDNWAFGVTAADVAEALDSAHAGAVPEGAVGAGTGMQLFDWKGGIGTASRVVDVGGRAYTIGILVNANFGARRQFRLAGRPLGRLLPADLPVRHREGSCIGILATDLPLHPAQLRRLARRMDIGLGLTGSVGNDGSGEVFLAFSTAHRIPRDAGSGHLTIEVAVEGQFWTHGSPFDDIFGAVVEASEEAVINALCTADTVQGRLGHRLVGFPVADALALL